jgi:hypothetical protein
MALCSSHHGIATDATFWRQIMILERHLPGKVSVLRSVLLAGGTCSMAA